MGIEIKKTDISDSLEYNTSVIVELLCINDLWKIEVPHIINNSENSELIHQLSAADDLVDKYTEILSDVFKKYNYKKYGQIQNIDLYARHQHRLIKRSFCLPRLKSQMIFRNMESKGSRGMVMIIVIVGLGLLLMVNFFRGA